MHVLMEHALTVHAQLIYSFSDVQNILCFRNKDFLAILHSWNEQQPFPIIMLRLNGIRSGEADAISFGEKVEPK